MGALFAIVGFITASIGFLWLQENVPAISRGVCRLMESIGFDGDEE